MMDESNTTDIPRSKSGSRLSIAGLTSSISLLVILMFLKSPGSGGPIIILFFLFLLFVITLCGVMLIIPMAVHLFKARQLSTLRCIYTALAVASGVVFLVGLQTLGQLQTVDVCLLLLFELLLNFYLLRRF